VKRGRPGKLRLKKRYSRKRYGAIARGARNPKQIAASVGRRRKRRK